MVTKLKIIPHVVHPSHVQFAHHLTEVQVGQGLDDVDALYDELQYYADVILGRQPPPIDSPYLGMMEVAAAYYARALEMDMMIHNEERKHTVVRGHPLYKFRTGSLRSFIEMAKKMTDLGSRRLTQEQILTEMRYDAGDN